MFEKKRRVVCLNAVCLNIRVSLPMEFDIISSCLDDDDLIEAKRSRELGKQIGLHVENEDKVIKEGEGK